MMMRTTKKPMPSHVRTISSSGIETKIKSNDSAVLTAEIKAPYDFNNFEFVGLTFMLYLPENEGIEAIYYPYFYYITFFVSSKASSSFLSFARPYPILPQRKYGCPRCKNPI